MLAAGPGEFKIRILMPASPQGIGLKSEQYGQRHFLKTCGVSRAANEAAAPPKDNQVPPGNESTFPEMPV